MCCAQQIPPVCGHDWSDAAAAVCGCTRTRASRVRVRVPTACVDWLRCCKPLRHAGHSWWRVRRDAFRFASCGAGAGACGGCVTIRRCCCCRDGGLWQFRRRRRLGFGGAQRGVCQPVWATPQVGRGVDAVARGWRAGMRIVRATTVGSQCLDSLCRCLCYGGHTHSTHTMLST